MPLKGPGQSPRDRLGASGCHSNVCQEGPVILQGKGDARGNGHEQLAGPARGCLLTWFLRARGVQGHSSGALANVPTVTQLDGSRPQTTTPESKDGMGFPPTPDRHVGLSPHRREDTLVLGKQKEFHPHPLEGWGFTRLTTRRVGQNEAKPAASSLLRGRKMPQPLEGTIWQLLKA